MHPPAAITQPNICSDFDLDLDLDLKFGYDPPTHYGGRRHKTFVQLGGGHSRVVFFSVSIFTDTSFSDLAFSAHAGVTLFPPIAHAHF